MRAEGKVWSGIVSHEELNRIQNPGLFLGQKSISKCDAGFFRSQAGNSTGVAYFRSR